MGEHEGDRLAHHKIGRGVAMERRPPAIFVGDALALDFLNTCPVQNAVATELLPDFSALLRWFVSAGQLTPAQATALERICVNGCY